MKKKLFEEILIALSLSNLLFITSWRRLIYPDSEPYHIKYGASLIDYLAVVLSILITALLFWGGLQFSRWLLKNTIFAKLCFLVVFGIILNQFRILFLWNESSTIVKIVLIPALIILSLIILIKFSDKIFFYLGRLMIILSPFILITFFQAFWGMINVRTIEEVPFTKQLAEIQPNKTKKLQNRVVWIIFDELGDVFSTGISPSLLNMPEFEKLGQESLTANNAIQPGDLTLKSIPTLLTGKIVEETTFAGENDLILTYQHQEAGKFSEAQNIFARIKTMGGQTSLIGWHHPYCRVIGKDLSACSWESSNLDVGFKDPTLDAAILRNFRILLNSIPFIGFRLFQNIKQNENEKNYIERHFGMLANAKESLVNPKIDLAFIHFPFPHNPFLYQKETGTFGGKGNYSDNLVLTDRIMRELRQDMEKADLWDSSTIIISSDHHLRISLYKKYGWEGVADDLVTENKDFAAMKDIENAKIPFFLKLKGQKEATVYDKPFNTVITHDLILAIMKGEISTVSEVKTWLDNR